MTLPFVSALRSLLTHVQRTMPPAGTGVSILGYHLIGGGTQSPVDIPTRQFEAQLDLLASAHRVVSLPRVLAGEFPADEHVLVLTFDDGFANFAEAALPLLEQRGLPVTLYVPVGFVDGVCGSPLTGVRLPALSWQELSELAKHPLVHIGSHGFAHADCRALFRGQLLDDLWTSRRQLEDHLRIEVLDFCYPQAKWSVSTEANVAEVYRSAAIAGGRVNRRPVTPLRLSRKPIRREHPEGFSALAAAGLGIEEALADWMRRHGSRHG